MNKKRLLVFVIITLVFFSQANAKSQRDEFQEAYRILHARGIYDSSHLKNYILHPYLEYERLKQNINISSDQSILSFIKRNQQSWLAEDISTDLLARFAKQKKWKAVLNLYKPNQGGNKAKCYGLEARVRTSLGKHLKKTLDEAIKVWLSGSRRPQNCNALFSLLEQRGLINDSMGWKRITLAMNKGNTRLAKDLTRHVSSKALASTWIKLRKKPSKYLKSKLLRKKDPRTRQVIAYGIKRLARKNTQKANKAWKRFQKIHPFTPKEKADIESYIGSRQAFDHNPYALQKLSAIPSLLRSEEASLWMARMAIRQADWRKLLNAIYSLPTETRNKDRWKYWIAFAQKETKKKITVNLEKLSENASFYGFLAADQLKKPYKRLLQKETNWNRLIPKIKNRASIKRATELFALGKDKLAKKEWFWTLKRLNKMEKLTAAAYAHQINQPFLGIITVSQTKDWNQTGLRFPLKYKSLVQKSARAQGIIPAWVYGIMRRESAFDPKIVSSANAKGLMQVLPSTAKVVARKLGLKNHRASDLLTPRKNVYIGSGYLSQMLKRFKGNYVKATASYNAGPHRIPRWAPDYPISAPQWIESIPFKETRNYVRAVMAYTTIYDHKLNYKSRRSLRLSQRLQKIGP